MRVQRRNSKRRPSSVIGLTLTSMALLASKIEYCMSFNYAINSISNYKRDRLLKPSFLKNENEEKEVALRAVFVNQSIIGREIENESLIAVKREPWSPILSLFRSSAEYLIDLQSRFFFFLSSFILQKKAASLKTAIGPEVATELAAVTATTSPVKAPTEQSESQQVKNSLSHRIVQQLVESFISKTAMHTLKFRVMSTSSNLTSLAQGKLKEVFCTFERLAFRNLKISGGGSLIMRDLSMSLLSFAPLLERQLKRFSAPFELEAKDCTMTQEDVMDSSSIRNGLQRLLNKVIKSALLKMSVEEVIMTLSVHNVKIIGTNKISCSGTAVTLLGSPFPFEVQTEILVSNDGHVIHFPQIELVINPGPLQVKIPIYSFFPVSVDIGDNAKITYFYIDGKREQLHLGAKAMIMPRLRSLHKYRANTIIDAKFKCDVGIWLTKVFRIGHSQ